MCGRVYVCVGGRGLQGSLWYRTKINRGGEGRVLFDKPREACRQLWIIVKPKPGGAELLHVWLSSAHSSRTFRFDVSRVTDQSESILTKCCKHYEQQWRRRWQYEPGPGPGSRYLRGKRTWVLGCKNIWRFALQNARTISNHRRSYGKRHIKECIGNVKLSPKCPEMQ